MSTPPNDPFIFPGEEPRERRPGAGAPRPDAPNLRDEASAFFDTVSERISTTVGVEKLQGFSPGEFFSAVFNRWTDEDIEEEFITGTRKTTPTLTEIHTGWPKPWAFFRVLVGAVLVFLAFQYGLDRFHNPRLLPGYVFAGSFAVPVACLIFFMEMNAPRNVSLYQVVKLFFLGGTTSIILSLFLFEILPLHTWIGASSAGLIEETGKLAAVLLYANQARTRYPWTLNALLFGAAVGTGFSAFESAGYALEQRTLQDITDVIVLRGVLSPGSHIAWTALAAAALWRVMGQRRFELAMLQDPRFLKVFGFVVLLHALWNAPFGIPLLGPDLGILAKCALLGVVSWIAVLSYVQDGLKQIQRVQRARLAAV